MTEGLHLNPQAYESHLMKNTILAVCKMEGPILHAAVVDSSSIPVVMTREEAFTEGERRLRSNEARSFQLWEIVSTFRPQVSIVAVEPTT